MTEENLENKIMLYLAGTVKVRGYTEKVTLTSHFEGFSERDVFVVTPWDVEQIALNTGAKTGDDVLKIVEQHNDDFAIDDNGDGLHTVRLIPEVFHESPAEENKLTNITGDVTVEDGFKWYLFHKIRLLSKADSRPVTVGDGIFAIKNELFLPDDFMPRVMMRMVEGRERVDVHESRKKLQPSGNVDAIYLLGKHNYGKFLEPHSLYFNEYVSPPFKTSLGELGDRISKAFTEFQKSERYENFLFSRIMRNVIFTVDSKKKRELGRPLFDAKKLELLEKKGVIRLQDEKGIIPEDVTVDSLKKLKAASEHDSDGVSSTWMSDSLHL